MRLRLIGQMEAWTVTSENVLPSGRKTRALLATIALSAPRPALRGRLAELLWSRRPEEQARASLRQEIHRLLETLSAANGEVIIVTRDHLTLRPGAVWVDVDEVMRASATQPASLSLLDGDLLEDLDGVDPSFDTWLTTERERLRDRARSVAETLLREQSDPETLIPAAQRLLQIDRAHEGAWRALMRAHAARGERGLAIQAYDRCRAVLADMLDAGPSSETQKLLNEIRGPLSSRLPLRPPAPPPAAAPPPVAAPPPETPTPPAEPAEEAAPGDSTPVRHTRGGARIGVLPMQMVGSSEADTHLGPGLAEEISTALARFRWMFVVASTSLGRYVAEHGSDAGIRRAFGIDFLVDGTIQRSGDRIRINLKLLDLRAGDQIVWARRFDRQSSDLLSLQDEIAAEVVAQIDPEILLIEARHTAAHPPIDATAYDLLLRAIPLMSRLEREPFLQAGDYLAQAIALEPDYGTAHAWYAYWHIFLIGQAWAGDPQAVMQRASDLADRAIALDPYDARALTIAGHVRAFLHRQPQEAAALHERALSLNPNLAMAWALSAINHAYEGNAVEAERRARRYKSLSPLDPNAFLFDGFFTVIHLLKHEFEAAAESGRVVTQMNASLSASYKPYLAALGHLHRDTEAAAARRRLLLIEPDFTIERFLETTPLARGEDRTLYAEGLRLAGVPESATC